MAKYRHRIFEMCDFLDEALAALTPKVPAQPPAIDFAPEELSFDSFDVMRSTGVTQVVFKAALNDAVETDTVLRDDLGRLADLLFRGSPVLVNFACISSFCDEAIDALVRFKQRLQTKGCRLALCCLEPAVRASFFPDRG